jgi:hypothetical protein
MPAATHGEKMAWISWPGCASDTGPSDFMPRERNVSPQDAVRVMTANTRYRRNVIVERVMKKQRKTS